MSSNARIAFRLKRFLGDCHGSSTTELSALVGIVLVCLAVGFGFLGQVVNSTFQIADAISPVEARSPKQASSKETVRAVQAEVPGKVSMAQVGIGGLALLVACTAPLVYVFLRSGKKPEREEEKQTKPVVVKPPSEDDIAFGRRQDMRRIFRNNVACLLNGHLKLRHIMSRQVTCTPVKAPVKVVADLMEEKKLHHVFVTQPDGSLVGIISKNDLIRRSGKSAAEIMTPDPTSLDLNADVGPSITLIIRERLACIPIMDGDRLAGVVTRADVLMALQCALQALESVVHDVKAGAVPEVKRPAKTEASAPPVQTAEGSSESAEPSMATV